MSLTMESSLLHNSLKFIDQAIIKAIAYSDIFDYPLTTAEIHRYLEKPASLEWVTSRLQNGTITALKISQVGPYYSLSGRENLVSKRLERAKRAEQLWPHAIRYAKWIYYLPFVRMVAVTGALSVDNADYHTDIDYFIVTEPGRLWLCRASIILLVHLASRQGVRLCPNYLISDQALQITEHNLYTAHELTQMVPLYGMNIYNKLREVNSWVTGILPNASGPPRNFNIYHSSNKINKIQRLSESILLTPPGDFIERWEMKRKIKKLSPTGSENGEVAFSKDYCKGHFGGYAQQTLRNYRERLDLLTMS